MKLRLQLLVLLGVLLFASPALAQTTLRFMWYADSTVQTETMQALLDEFMELNPDIMVELDVVPYATITDNLELLLETGEGPDLARVTDLGGLEPHYLDMTEYVDAAYWEENFGPYLDWLDPSDTGKISGMQLELTVTAPYVNKTYFEQAGVEMPEAGATWEDWISATTEVANMMNDAGLEVFPLAMDSRTHRLAGPAISNGAEFFDAEGNPAINDQGFRDTLQLVVDWTNEGVLFPDPWLTLDGALAGDTFANGGAVMLMSGSWKLGGFPEQIGDAFDWTAVANPCGPGGCTGMPGGSAVVAFADTENPEAVARLIDYLASPEAYETYTAQTFSIPAHIGLANAGVDYPTDNESLRSSLQAFVANVPELSPVAFEFQGYPNNFVIYGAVQERLSQILNGELGFDEGIERMVADIDEQVNQ